MNEWEELRTISGYLVKKVAQWYYLLKKRIIRIASVLVEDNSIMFGQVVVNVYINLELRIEVWSEI